MRHKGWRKQRGCISASIMGPLDAQSFPPVRNDQISITVVHFTAQCKGEGRRLWIMASSRSKQEPVFIGSGMITCRGSSKGQGREEGPTEELIGPLKQRKTCFTTHRTHQDTKDANTSDS